MATTKLEVARQLGADLLLNHHRQDVAREVRNLTGVGADVVIADFRDGVALLDAIFGKA